MNLLELSKYLLDEEAAEQYLLDNGILKNFVECPYCQSKSIGKIRRGRMKCYKCKKEWHRRKDSFLESRHISYSKFIGMLKLYSYSFGINKIAVELDLDIKSIIDHTSSLRRLVAIEYNSYLDQEHNELYLSTDQYEHIIVLPTLNNTDTKAKLLISRIKSADKSFTYNLQLTWIDKAGANHWNSIHRFANYLKFQLLSFRGISFRYFNEYLFELLYRFNHPEEDLYDHILIRLQIDGWPKLQ